MTNNDFIQTNVRLALLVGDHETTILTEKIGVKREKPSALLTRREAREEQAPDYSFVQVEYLTLLATALRVSLKVADAEYGTAEAWLSIRNALIAHANGADELAPEQEMEVVEAEVVE